MVLGFRVRRIHWELASQVKHRHGSRRLDSPSLCVGLRRPWDAVDRPPYHRRRGGAHVSLVVATEEVDLGGGQDLQGQDVQDGGRGLGAGMTGGSLRCQPPPPLFQKFTAFEQKLGAGENAIAGDL